jgi:hypothetical protein
LSRWVRSLRITVPLPSSFKLQAPSSKQLEIRSL